LQEPLGARPGLEARHKIIGVADDNHITTLDKGGLALPGVQALYRLSFEKDAQIRKLTAEVERLAKVETEMAALEAHSNGAALREQADGPRSDQSENQDAGVDRNRAHGFLPWRRGPQVCG
jgi:hypothetical protein